MGESALAGVEADRAGVTVDIGVWSVDGDAPRRVSRGGVGLERRLEDWIARDASLLSDGLTIVGRQVHLEGGFLDLLAIDWRDRWVVIELKRERLYRDALAQALDYASSVARLGADELEELLRPGIEALGDADELSRAVRRQLDGEDGDREVAVLLAGVGVDAGLQRIVSHLGRYGVPITIVSFQVFEPENGSRLLMREVTEEESPPPRREARRYSVDAIRLRAQEAGVAAPFDRFLEMATGAGLVARPYSRAVMIAPPANRSRYLMYARPESGGIVLSAGPVQFAEFFPPLSEEEATAALGPAEPGGAPHLSGAELDARLDQLEAFLQSLPRAEDDVE